MLAILCREPFNMTKQQFLKLTDWDLYNIYFRPNHFEDDPSKGYWPVPRIDPTKPPPKQLGWKQMFFDTWRERGLSEAQIEERWQAWSRGMRR